MKSTHFIAFSLLLLCCLLLAGCGASAPSQAAPTPTPAPTSTPVPTPTPIPEILFLGVSYTPDVEQADWSAMSRADMDGAKSALAFLENLKGVELGEKRDDPEALAFSDVAELMALRPDVEFHMTFTLYGDSYTTLDTEMDLAYLDLAEDDSLVRQVLPCMTHCHFVNMDSCNISNETMAKLRDDFPDKGIVWRVSIGPSWAPNYYGIRTDAERLLISDGEVPLTTKDVTALQYCTKLRYLDIGHNYIDDISFLENMPDLEVAILALNSWSDASPIRNCKKLEYLEIFTTKCEDLSPLAELKELKHLNICWLFDLKDISPLYGLTQLERLWIGKNHQIPQEQLEEIQQRLPNTVVNITTGGPAVGGWRDDPRYDLLREQMGYNQPYNRIFSYYYLDPTYRGSH